MYQNTKLSRFGLPRLFQLFLTRFLVALKYKTAYVLNINALWINKVVFGFWVQFAVGILYYGYETKTKTVKF